MNYIERPNGYRACLRFARNRLARPGRADSYTLEFWPRDVLYNTFCRSLGHDRLLKNIVFCLGNRINIVEYKRLFVNVNHNPWTHDHDVRVAILVTEYAREYYFRQYMYYFDVASRQYMNLLGERVDLLPYETTGNNYDRECEQFIRRHGIRPQRPNIR